MTRPVKSRIIYGLVIILGSFSAIPLIVYTPFDKWMTLIVFTAILLIPGRIQSYVFRDHYLSRQKLADAQYQEAIDYCEQFLFHIQAKPWQKKLICFAWGIYSWDIEAMTLNNKGIALMNLERFDDAKTTFNAALALDPLYAVPHFNLAVIAAAEGDHETAEQKLQRAISLGYRKTTLDDVMHFCQKRDS